MNTTEFRIDEVSLENAGIYTVMIYNSCGTTIIQFDVTVEEDPNKVITSVLEEIIFSDLRILPNPASNFISFEFETVSEVSYTLEIVDLTGAVVFANTGISNPQVLNKITIDDLQHQLINGTYFVNLLIDGKSISKSFVISK